jgi:hypothetical protein
VSRRSAVTTISPPVASSAAGAAADVSCANAGAVLANEIPIARADAPMVMSLIKSSPFENVHKMNPQYE